jgi:hypothetical protein
MGTRPAPPLDHVEDPPEQFYEIDMNVDDDGTEETKILKFPTSAKVSLWLVCFLDCFASTKAERQQAFFVQLRVAMSA